MYGKKSKWLFIKCAIFYTKGPQIFISKSLTLKLFEKNNAYLFVSWVLVIRLLRLSGFQEISPALVALGTG